MVLTRPVGMKRPFWRGFVLTVLTFGFYAAYWTLKAPTEVYKQFQLEEEGRGDGVAWLVVGMMLPALVFVYNFKFLGNVAYVRARLGLPRGMSAWTFTGLQVAGGVIVVTGVGWGLLLVDADLLAQDDPFDPDAEFEPLPPEAGYAMLAGLVLGVPVIAYGYHRVQHDLNEVWDAYHARLRALTALAAPSPDPDGGPEDPGTGP